MADRYAPALLLDVLAFWFLLRWLLPATVLLLFGRALIGMMAIGTLGTLDEHHYVWALFFAVSAVLAWVLLRRWRTAGPARRRQKPLLPTRLVWRHATPPVIATLCERRVGIPVDAAVPATLPGTPGVRVVLALAGDAVWVLDDQSSHTRARVGRVMASWARRGLVSHVETARGRHTLELSWPSNHALVRGLIPAGPLADAFAGQLLADELADRT